ncbi:aldo/keto reductase [Eubacteriales bacterium OttesenSCG-928-M02]|nr:aldo/keto reductase [Eubacteriales bacterium OttesenSCG-928-M02]
MQYRDFGNGQQTSLLGMGVMRFPTEPTEDGGKKPIQEVANELVKAAIDRGITYFDSAYVYSGGHADAALGKAIGAYRHEATIATKLPSSIVEKTEDFQRFLDEQLEHLNTDIIDVYLMHGLGVKRLDKMIELGMREFLDDALASGKVGRVAFSNHDGVEGFMRTLDSYDNWGMAQVQYNILDKYQQASIKGLDYAYDKGVPIVVMEGLRGGDLANAPEAVKARYEKEGKDWSPVEWAFRFIADHPAVRCILSGMTEVSQIEENAAIFDRLPQPGNMTEAEEKCYDDVREIYQNLIQVPCTSCNYCQPCPQNIRIPGIFTQYNRVTMFNNEAGARADYKKIVDEGRGADQCIRCGVCETKCLQGVNIMDDLEKAHTFFTK